MKILSMTATFGKLENQTLRLEPGLNIICAPNEWGKSTWCVFLATMLYGLDTREKTTKTALAVKERYAPWSGAPMSGRMDLLWNGRAITIERWTKGRTPLGEFRAYETESGLAIPELTATNCGETLLGVEKSVFLRAGFLRLADLPVTADESLRRRLNALVTTGDESSAADELGQTLKDLKNKVRYNRSGLLPQAEKEREQVQQKLSELRSLQQQRVELLSQQAAQETQLTQLQNHLAALAYAAAQENIRQVEQAHLAAETAAENMAKLEDACAGLMSKEEALSLQDRHAQLLQAQAGLMQEWSALPPEPSTPQVPERYRNMEPEEAVAQAEKDTLLYTNLEQSKKKNYRALALYPLLLALFALLGFLIHNPYVWLALAVCSGAAAVALVLICTGKAKRSRREMEELLSRYPDIRPDHWVEDAATYAESQRQYDQMMHNALRLRREIRHRIDENEQALSELTGGLSSRDFLLRCSEVITKHDALADARREQKHAAAHAAALSAMVKPVPKPETEDRLTSSELETHRLLGDGELRLKQLQHRLGQCQGNMEALGAESALLTRLDALNQRIDALTKTYNALDTGLLTLEKAAAELQRRFAPRISQQAQELFHKLTNGRYERLNLQQDLSVNAAAADEVAMRAAQWRSEGTVDQLYLALRLAVARELTPTAPLILDDVLVRFDDTRHAAAMEILRQEAEGKQVVLFTCQSREQSET